MAPQTIFCLNPACPARGQSGEGNIPRHSQKKRRYRCSVCRQTFTPSKGTLFYRRHKDALQVVCMVTLLAHGCPPQAIVHAFGWAERSVYALLQHAGPHCERVPEHLGQQPRDRQHVQADAVRVKLQGAIVWVAMAREVRTRLWLGAVVSLHRDANLLVTLMQRVRPCARERAVLFCTDGLRSYNRAIQRVLREARGRR